MSKLRKTKIIGTVGPASNDKKTMKALIDAGLNCFRLNASHSTPKDRKPIIDKIKKVRKSMNAPVSILLDTRGPEFRILSFEKGNVTLKDGDKFIFTTDDIIGNKSKVSVNYKKICSDMVPGDIILANDGLVKFEVQKVTDTDVICKTIIGGTLSDHKSLNFPEKELTYEYLSDVDKADLLSAIEEDLDYIACSFVSNGNDIKAVRDFMHANGGSDITLISKIENQSGIDNIEEICRNSDGIMVARGDLGVEIDYDRVPVVQKKIIRKCIERGKLAITSTEMMESMINNPRPTRAEISDVANSVYDGTSAVMLSGETAIGKYPVESVEAMAKILKSTEKFVPYKDFIKRRKMIVKGRTVDAIAHATCTIAVDVDAKGIVNLSRSGFTSELISNFRPHVDVVTITLTQKEYFKLSLYWGINPICGAGTAYDDEVSSSRKIVDMAIQSAAEVLGLHMGEKIVINSG